MYADDPRRSMIPLRRANAPRTNVRALVALAVGGQVANALVRGGAYRIGRDGVLRIVPGTGGIALNKRVGDRAIGLVADHVEPGVSVRNNDREPGSHPGAPNRGLLLYSCVGNVARVVSGPAAGSRGTVTGKHGGINNLLVDFAPAVKQRLRIGDRIQVRAFGQGLALLDYPRVRAMNLAPRLLARWGVRGHGSHLHVPVTHIIPAGVMGSGLGRQEGVFGDTDIQLSDPALRRRYRLDTLRFGDLVAIHGMDARFGASRRADAMTVGVVVHSDSNVAGHGPGVTPLLMSSSGGLLPVYSPHANIALLLGIRQAIAAVGPPPAEERARVWTPAARLALGGDRRRHAALARSSNRSSRGTRRLRRPSTPRLLS
jgi:hypothetical protein